MPEAADKGRTDVALFKYGILSLFSCACILSCLTSIEDINAIYYAAVMTMAMLQQVCL